ncbi:MAG: hypothetical protein J6S75_10580, partial [Thermoguttaceae bacterium]|nr:hypothetical protein [Thermoguttaceae bacterium]
WDFLGWKLAYNASAQFDDYRKRYRWVIRGFEFLQKGTGYNKKAPKLFMKTGWTISQKIGIADEKNQYRRLFREDDEFHAKQVYKERDNWLFGRNFYLDAEDLYNKGGDIGKETRILFFSRSRTNLLRYAQWMEQDGCGKTKDNTPLFDEDNAAAAWRDAEEKWNELCRLRVETVIEDPKNPGKFRWMSLSEVDECRAEIAELVEKLKQMLPEGTSYESIVWDRWNNVLEDRHRAALSSRVKNPAPEVDPNNGERDRPFRVLRDYLDGKHGEFPEWADWEKKLDDLTRKLAVESVKPEDQEAIANAFDIPVILRTDEQQELMGPFLENFELWGQQAEQLFIPSVAVMADCVEGDNHQEALDICDRIADLAERSRFAAMFTDIMGSVYRQREVVFEQEPEARAAREHRYLSRVRFYSGQVEEANQEFLDCEASWMALCDRPEYADLLYRSEIQGDFLAEDEKYTIILVALGKIFPIPYPFEPLEELVYREAGHESMVSAAKSYLNKSIDEKDPKAFEDARTLMHILSGFFSATDTAKLFPTQKIRDDVTEGANLLARAYESLDETKRQQILGEGFFSQYPCRSELELLMTKGDPLYQELELLYQDYQRSLYQAGEDPDHAADIQDKISQSRESLIEKYSELVKKYPMLKYDVDSSLYPRISMTVAQYVQQLKQDGKEIPEDFALKAFLPE